MLRGTMKQKTKIGKVWLAGAGPGDAGLLTVKTGALLQEADVIVYDALISAEILSLIPGEKEKINVGKRSDHHLVPQKEINQILCEKAKEGKKVLRLKGGDPFVFGRGGEEMELLAMDGIPFEVVPGITSAVAVPAYAGIPVTHRSFTSSFHVITGHARRGGQERVDYEALVKLNGTLIFLMGVTAMEEICEKLIRAGMNSDMPAAILENGTNAGQRKVIATVSDLPQRAKEARIKAPAIIVVGGVSGLGNDFEWASKRPLGGMQIVTTRPEKKNSALAEKLRSLGAQVIELPAIQTEELPYEGTKQAVDFALARVKQKKEKRLEGQEWFVFTSPVGVEFFFNELRNRRIDIRTLEDVRFAVIGSATEKALQQYGIFADLVPETYSAQALGELLAERADQDDHITLLRAEEASEFLAPPLLEKGISVTECPLYRTIRRTDTALKEKLQGMFAQGEIDYVTFTSASTVDGFVKAMDGLKVQNIKGLCIGPWTEAKAREYKIPTVVSKEATIDSMIEALLERRFNHAESIRHPGVTKTEQGFE